MARDRASAGAPHSACKRQKRSATVSTSATAPLLPALLAPGAAHGLAALPSTILKLIFAYACDCVKGDVLPRPAHSKEALWSHSIADIVDEFNASTHAVRFQTPKRRELTEVLRALEAKGDSVRDLRVWFEVCTSPGRRDRGSSKRFFKAVEEIKIDWRRVFTSCPHLVRLDMSLVSLNSRHLSKILDAASTLCRGIQVLILPKEQAVWHVEREPDFDGIQGHLYHVLRR